MPEDQLPVTLPELRGADLKPKGVSPLAGATEWVEVACPQCGGPATRDTDTMDTFVDSSWYFLRYCSPHDKTQAFDTDLVNAWGPCDIYIGGVEHAVLHLLYARFFTMVLNDMGLVGFREPFSAQLNQGIVINQGKKMSKSLGNGVSLGDQLSAFGVDAVRLTLVFAGPPEDDIDWADMSPAGSLRFLQRVWRLSGDVTSPAGTPADDGDVALRRVTHKTVHEVGALLEAQRFNVVVARVMELVNATRKAVDGGPGPADAAVREAAEAVAIMLSLVAPYTAEEMWERLGHEPTVARVPLARGRPGAAGGGHRDRRRPGAGQGPQSPGGVAVGVRGRPARGRAGGPRCGARPGRSRRAHRHRAGAQAGQRGDLTKGVRRTLSGRTLCLQDPSSIVCACRRPPGSRE